jgi:hypothetical protein
MMPPTFLQRRFKSLVGGARKHRFAGHAAYIVPLNGGSNFYFRWVEKL